jgi:hypothetical protein
MTEIHDAVIQSLRETFSAEAFEAHLLKTASDDSARASREAERSSLLARIPVLGAEEAKLANAVASCTEAPGALLAAIKDRQAEREQAEAGSLNWRAPSAT